MTGVIASTSIEDVRQRIDIVQVIGQHVELRRRGASYVGLCPFHEEKTPSFNVIADKQFFHCFGCHESGDVYAFLMKLEGRSFVEVVEDLAQRAGVELQQEGGRGAAAAERRTRNERQQALELNERVANFYQAALRSPAGEQAQSYLAGRGIAQAASQAFRLGFAPGRDALVRQLHKHKISMDLAQKLGLVARSRRNEGHYDRFSNRLVCPIIGAAGEVFGFSARQLSAESQGPKYLNTPETIVFHKGKLLYGLHQASAAMRRNEHCLLVEGNFDVIQLHQAGFDHAVAPLGTALTEHQLRLIRRFCPKIVTLFDGDKAGRAAVRRAIPMIVAAGLALDVAELPEEQDPDGLLASATGAAGLQQILRGARPGIEYLLEQLKSAAGDTVPAKARILEQIAPVVAALPSQVAKDLYTDKLAMSLSVARPTVARAVAGDKSPVGRLQGSQAARPTTEPAVARVAAAELDPLAILVEHPYLFARASSKDLLSLLTNHALRATYSAAIEMQAHSGGVDVPQLLQRTDPSIRDAVAESLISKKYAADGDPTRALDDCLFALRDKRIARELGHVRGQICAAQSQGDDRTLDLLRQQLIKLVEERRHIHETR